MNRERAGDRGATTIPVAQYGPNVEWDAKQEKFEKEAIMPKAFLHLDGLSFFCCTAGELIFRPFGMGTIRPCSKEVGT